MKTAETKQEPARRAALELTAPAPEGCAEVLSSEALGFVADLVREFGPRVREVLTARETAQARWDAGEAPDFLPETREVRDGDWRVAPIPADLRDRRVEITGPVERKMIINALNSGASVFMADFEDSNSPTWENVVRGQLNLRDAVQGEITFEQPETGKVYRLVERPAVLLVRPRGWHLPEKHVRLAGQPVPAALVDFGLYFFHNARALVARGTGPYFYLPKMQHWREAALWNDVFVRAQERLGLPRGTIRATVLIETLPAAFQMDEILHALREHSGGLNCGRWDYIFSYIKTFRNHADKVLPDRGQVGMTQPFMRAYTRLLIRTCHRRGIHAMGGMAAQIPIKRDPAANEAALAKVRADKEREVTDGHDGTWVAHPGLVALAREVFDAHLKGPNQIERLREDVQVTREDLITPPAGTRTEAGLRQNVSVGLQYLEAWLRGSGCVPLYDLMEDAATAEISRSQLWQWVRHRARLEDGREVTPALVTAALDEELARLRDGMGAAAFERTRYGDARELFLRVCLAEQFSEFLTLPAYEVLE